MVSVTEQKEMTDAGEYSKDLTSLFTKLAPTFTQEKEQKTESLDPFVNALCLPMALSSDLDLYINYQTHYEKNLTNPSPVTMAKM